MHQTASSGRSQSFGWRPGLHNSTTVSRCSIILQADDVMQESAQLNSQLKRTAELLTNFKLKRTKEYPRGDSQTQDKSPVLRMYLQCRSYTQAWSALDMIQSILKFSTVHCPMQLALHMHRHHVDYMLGCLRGTHIIKLCPG